MAPKQPQMCLACSVNPATTKGTATVPLCSTCAGLVKGSRGVKFEKRKPKPRIAAVR